jgi:hypothetical protein
MGCIGAHHIGSRALVKDESALSHSDGCLFSPRATVCVTVRQHLLKLLADLKAGRDPAQSNTKRYAMPAR